MRLSLVSGTIGHLLYMFAVAFAPPLILALVQQQFDVAGHFAAALAAAAGCGWAMKRRLPRNPTLRRAEAMAIVAGTWLVVGVFSAIPYMFAGLSVVNAVFESISGLTTTGATILTDFSAYGEPFFLWRAMTQWFGGLGVIALFVVVLPRLGIAGRQLFFAEASISTSEGISTRIRGAAQKLWVLYAGLTLLLALLLLRTGFDPFNAVVHALTTMSAGGFSPDPRSIQGFGNRAAEWILVVFMVLAGTSFPLQWRLFSGRVFSFFRDGEFRVYLAVMGITTLVLAFVLGSGAPDEQSFRASAFQVTSMASSTGYASVDFEQWQMAAKALLVVAMIAGGCAGSACGGPKVVRYILMAKFLRREMTQVLHPSAVLPIRYHGRPIALSILRAVTALVFLYVIGYLVVGLLLMMIEPSVDLHLGMSASLACMGNIGPAFGPAGPMGSYDGFSDISKVLLTLAMWMGRLELITVLALFHPHVWRHLRWSDRAAR